MAKGDISGSKLYLKPNGYKAGLLMSEQPTDGTGDFTFAGSAVDRINSSGVSETVAANVPRLDYQGEYIVPTDNSSYSFNGTSDYATYNATKAFLNGSDFTALITFTINDTSGFRGLINTSASAGGGGQGFALYIATGTISFDFFGTTNGRQQIDTLIPITTGLHDIGFTYNATTFGVEIFLDGVSVYTKTMLNPNDFNISTGFIGSINTTALLFNGYIKKIGVDNRILTLTEQNNWFNGISIEDKYIGANNVSVTAGSFVVGLNYRIDTIGTTDFTLIGASANTIGLEFVATGVGTGTGTATTAGNTLLLDGGKTASTWYDKTHADKGTITGSTLVNSNNFTNEVHPVLTCPQLRTSPNITNSFLNSATPVTQTVTTVIGIEYTISCNGVGLLTVDETGGNGRGGVVTEVDPFTYTATATSMVVTVVTAPNNVNFKNTNVPVRHIPTLGTSVTKVKDQITQKDISAYATNNFEIYLEQEIFNDAPSTVSFLLSSATENIKINNNVFDVNPGGTYTLPSGKNKIIAQNNASNFVLYVNGSLVLTDTRLTTILDTLDLTYNDGVIQDIYKSYYNDANNLSTASEMITKTT